MPDDDAGSTAPATTPAGSKRYDAFISYSHSADGQLAPALQRGLQQFARPWRQRRSLEVFRDETGLAVNPDLWQSILAALDASSHFVLLASPEAARSRWVGQEIEHCVRTKGSDRVVVVLTDGTLTWDPAACDFTADSDAAHPALRGLLDEAPVVVDMSWARQESDLTNDDERFRLAVAEITAAVLGRPLAEVVERDARERRRTRRVVRSAIGVLAGLGALAVVAAGLAVLNQRSAAEERSRAEAEAARAEQQRAAAEEQAAIALGRELAIRATTTATADEATPRTARTALALATEAYALAPGTDTAGALLTVVTGVARSTGVVSAPQVLPSGYDASAVWSSSPSGRVSLQQDGPGRVVDLRGGTEWTDLPGAGFALAPTGDLAVGLEGTVVRLEDGGGVSRVAQLPPGSGPTSFSADGDRVAYARIGADPEVVVADLGSGEVSTYAPDPALVGCATCTVGVALSPQGDRVVLRSRDPVTGADAQVVSLEVTALGEPLEMTARRAMAGPGSVRFSDDGTEVWVRDGGLLRVVDPGSLEDVAPSRAIARGGVLSFVDDARAIVSADGCEPPGLVAAPAMAVVGTLPADVSFTEGGCDPGGTFASWLVGDEWILTDAGVWPAGGDALLELACASLDPLSDDELATLTGLSGPRAACRDGADASDEEGTS